MEREAVYVTEKKDKIERIKKKYNNMSMSDQTADKIRTLEITNSILKSMTAVVGIVTVVDYCVPDAIPFVDEALLTGLTTLLGTASSMVNNHIDEIAKNGTTEVKIEEIEKLSREAATIAKTVKQKNRK